MRPFRAARSAAICVSTGHASPLLSSLLPLVGRRHRCRYERDIHRRRRRRRPRKPRRS